MRVKLCFLLLVFGLSVEIFASACSVEATLGESVDSIESDRAALSATRGTATAQDGYTVHEVNYDSTTVREYVSSSGIVFAIAWNGLVRPDLTQLLGSYAGEYQKALEQTAREPGRRRLRVKTDKVVVEHWGHMRNLQGRAYVPALIPPGVSTNEIR